jgi:acetyl-CoA synthetase
MITPLPGAIADQAGLGTGRSSACKPQVLDATVRKGRPRAICASPTAGRARCAPSTATMSASIRNLFLDLQKYFTGDGCRRDADGYYWITGRVDDVINVSATAWARPSRKRAGGASKVAEAAVVGYPHDIKGQGIYCYVTLMKGVAASDELRKELVQQVGAQGDRPHRQPDLIQFAPGLPKTRSGQDHAPHPAQDRRGSNWVFRPSVCRRMGWGWRVRNSPVMPSAIAEARSCITERCWWMRISRNCGRP